MPFPRCLQAGWLAASMLLPGVPAASASPAPKVIIIGIDGTMPTALAVANTPNLDRLMSNGCHSVRVVSHPVTHSAAAWSSMFTGVWGDKHGVNDPGNSFSGNRFAQYPSFYERLEAIHPEWNTYALARWAPMLTAVPEADVAAATGSDAAGTTETRRILTEEDPDVMWTLLLDVDSAGHSYGWGPGVPQYVAAIETADGRVGQMLDALTNRVTYADEDWLVIIQTDHGEHDHPDIERSQIVFTIYSGSAAARGVLWPSPSIVDVCATVFAHMGVPIDPAWDLDAQVAGLARPLPGYGTNLLFNGDAEANSGTNNYSPNRGIAWWFDVASTTLGTYDAHPDFPSLSDPGPAGRGRNFFLGGTTDGAISQRIDLAHLANDIDATHVTYELSGWFGGVAEDEDIAWLTARFLDAGGVTLGSNEVGRVTAEERGQATALLERQASALLPPGTRQVEFVLIHDAVGAPNNALADQLSFVLLPPPDEPVVIVDYGATPEGWSVTFLAQSNRLYTLERSGDLEEWTDAAPAEAGTGSVLILIDPSPDPALGFYRVACRRP